MGARVSRSTFYRNFQDKYQLLRWSCRRLVANEFPRPCGDETYQEVCESFFAVWVRHPLFFRNGMLSKDPCALGSVVHEMGTAFCRRLLGAAGYDADLKSNIDTVGLYVGGAVSFAADWARAGMPSSPGDAAGVVAGAFPHRFARCLSMRGILAVRGGLGVGPVSCGREGEGLHG